MAGLCVGPSRLRNPALRSRFRDSWNSTNQQGGKLARQRSEDSREAEPEDSPHTNQQVLFIESTLLVRKLALKFTSPNPQESFREIVLNLLILHFGNARRSASIPSALTLVFFKFNCFSFFKTLRY